MSKQQQLEHKGLTAKSEVLGKIANNFDLTKEQAEFLIEYHAKLRRTLNEIGNMSLITKNVELRDGIATEVTSGIAKAVEAIPVIGSIAGLIGYGVNRTTKAIETATKEKRFNKVGDLNPSGDSKKWCDFTRVLADEMVARQTEQLKNLNKKGLAEKIDQDCSEIIKKMTSKEFEGKNIEYDGNEVVDSLTDHLKPSASNIKPLSSFALQIGRSEQLSL